MERKLLSITVESLLQISALWIREIQLIIINHGQQDTKHLVFILFSRDIVS